MPFVPAPNIVQVELRATRNNQQVENRFMVNNLGPPDQPTLLALATFGWNWWQDTYAPALHTSCHLVEAVATDMSLQNGQQVTYAPSTGVNGVIVGGALPNEVSFCVSLRSASRGRSARGRLYTLSVANAQMQDDNSLTVGAETAFVTAVQTLINTINSTGRQFTIVSYRANGVPRPGGPVYFPVLAAVSVDRLVDSMKRRKPGVGS